MVVYPPSALSLITSLQIMGHWLFLGVLLICMNNFDNLFMFISGCVTIKFWPLFTSTFFS